MDPQEVRARGRGLRDVVDHNRHRNLFLSATRPSIPEYVDSGNKERLPELLSLRIGRMLSSPFAFFRGNAGLMAGDLAAGPGNGLEAQLCGDAHAANFGLYGTHDGRIVMDINDFDETATGPWEWDLKRLAVSLILAGRVGGVSEEGCHDAAEDAVRSYRRTAQHLAELPFLESWTALGDESVLNRVKADELLDDFTAATRKARKNTSAKMTAKWTRREGEGWRFIVDPPVQNEVSPATAQSIIGALPQYVDTLRDSRAHLMERFHVSDVAFRVVGTGSVGMRNYLILFRGNGDETLVLQAKQAKESALSCAHSHHAWIGHEGERIVHGARLVQAETDPFLGWTTIEGRPFIVRQFRNQKGEIDVTALKRDRLDDYGRLAGALLSRAHSRSIDPRLLAGYCDDGEPMDSAFADYAVAYANQTESDYSELASAVQQGRIPATTES